MNDFFDKFSRVPLGQKMLLLLLVMAAIFIVFYMFFYNSLEQQIVEKRTEQQQLSTDQARLRSLRERAAELDQAVSQAQRQREGFRVELPDTDRIPALLDELGQTAQAVSPSARGGRLEISVVRPRSHVRGGDYTRIPVELELSGTYDQILDFCWALANMGRIVHVRAIELRIQSGRNAPGPPVLRADLDIEAFFRPEG